MTDAPEAVACETRAGQGASAFLPEPVPTAPAKKQPKRQRPHVRQTRYSDAELAEFEKRARAAGLTDGAYTRLATIGGPGPRARRRAPVDEAALMQGLAAFNRVHNNLNQITRALNTMIVAAEENGAPLSPGRVGELLRPIELLREEFAAPLAAILGAVSRDREG